MVMMTGAEAVAQILCSEGVEYVFGLPGSTEMHLLDALEDHPEIKFILGLHESIAVGMAEGYSRISGKVGVASLHTSVGVSAAMSGLCNASGAGTPMVILAGQNDSRILNSDPALTGNLTAMASEYIKWGTEVSYVNDIPMVLRRAFKIAKDIPTGTSFVSLPRDLMAQIFNFEYSPSGSYSSKLHPNPDDVTRAVELLIKAKSPVIFVGAGVAKDNAVFEVVKLAELLGAYVYQTWVADMNFPTSHPLYRENIKLPSMDVKNALQSTDVIISIGNPMFRVSAFQPEQILSPETKLVQIDSDIWEIGKNLAIDAGIVGDIQISVANINNLLQKEMSAEMHREVTTRTKKYTQEKQVRKEALYKKALAEKEKLPISASRLMQEIKKCLRSGSIIVDDSWSNMPALHNYIDFDEPGSYHRVRDCRNGGGSIGWGMPASIGIKLASPDRPVIAVIGDGSAIFYVQSIWTAAHYKIPIVFIILSNASYRTLKSSKLFYMGEQVRGRFLGMEFSDPQINFCQLAQSMGVHGQRVAKPEELEESLKVAIALGKPAVVEIVIDAEV